MDNKLRRQISFLVFLLCGFVVTQLYQNCAPMPLEGFATLSSEAIKGHSESGGLGSHPSIGDNQKIQPTQKTLVASKVYVAEIFREVFTSTKYPIAGYDNLIDKWIFKKGAQFGGNCNLYSNYSNVDCNGSLANTNLSYYTDSSTVRESFRVQMCENSLGLDNGVHAALEKVGLTINSTINGANLASSYALFYRGDAPNSLVIDTLLDLDKTLQQSNQTPLNRWRAILTQVCESPGWQLL